IKTCQLHILCLLAPAHSALFRWFLVTTIQTHLQAEALLMGTLLDACRLRLSAITPFHPASGVDD
ncbi:hypothetical protein, partial [Tolypothrix sp. VBCCA 56010]|uniref:hypothetical protein n=1 Tax=Tolypothrix sp. VBCCA 56010 TaxID=3137731 RepID=UPI003D7E8DE4